MWVCYWDTPLVRKNWSISTVCRMDVALMVNKWWGKRQRRGLHADTLKKNGRLISVTVCAVTLRGKFGDCPPKKNDSISCLSTCPLTTCLCTSSLASVKFMTLSVRSKGQIMCDVGREQQTLRREDLKLNAGLWPENAVLLISPDSQHCFLLTMNVIIPQPY